jgi:hypothetical protein
VFPVTNLTESVTLTMQNAYKFTYLLLAVVIVAGTVELSTRKALPQGTSQSDNRAKWKEREEEAKRNFPTADFNEPDPVEPERRTAHKAKQKRHNGLGLVSRNPDPDSGGGAFIPEGQFDFPALPVATSDIIVVGQVLAATAHLSEDKTNVYSEFTIRIASVLKGNVSPGSEIVVERLGGYVLYPGGRKLLYRVGTAAMPRVGGKYVFFLSASTQDLSIITAYEFRDGKVLPLDFSEQFDQYRGFDETVFLNEVNNALPRP